MSDLYFSVKRERWAYVALLGLLAVHLGIILSILSFEGALKVEIQTYIEVVGILIIFAGLVLIVISAYLRNLQRKEMRWFSQNTTHRKKFRPSSYNIQVGKESEKKGKVTPMISRHSSKSKVSPWFSESSGLLPEFTSNRNIAEWLKEHPEQIIKPPQDSYSFNRLTSLV